MGKRLLLGLLKGIVIGGAFGALVHFVFEAPHLVGDRGWANWLLYPIVGAVSGALSGRAPWKPGAWIASILKAVFGLAVGAGLFALGRFLPPVALIGHEEVKLAFQPLFFAPMLATAYATLVELDDGGDQAEEEPASGVRVGKISVDVIDVGEEEEAPAAKPAAKSKKN